MSCDRFTSYLARMHRFGRSASRERHAEWKVNNPDSWDMTMAHAQMHCIFNFMHVQQAGNAKHSSAFGSVYVLFSLV